jgi:hypothetical protein
VSTTDKDFKVKNGLVVEGSSGTISGSNIITQVSLDEELANLPDFKRTDLLPGESLYVGENEPSGPTNGDLWIDDSSLISTLTWGKLIGL